VNKERCK